MLEFTPDEIATLRALLGKIAENGGYWPDEETMRIAHGAISYWACELVLLRDGKNGLEILLAEYSDGVEAFLGMWHIPGGYNKVLEKDTQETCSRVAQREIGVDVDYCETLDSYKWAPGEHPLVDRCRCMWDVYRSGK